VALLLPPFAGGKRRRAALDLTGERQCGPPDLVEAPARLDPYVDVKPSGPGGLGPAGEPEVTERTLDHLRHLAYLLPLDARDGIEVDPQLVGMVQVLGADRMRVQLEAGEVAQPGQRRRVPRHDLVRASA
jgi:hypothetical protein